MTNVNKIGQGGTKPLGDGGEPGPSHGAGESGKGVNAGPQNKLPHLAKMFEHMGLESATTGETIGNAWVVGMSVAATAAVFSPAVAAVYGPAVVGAAAVFGGVLAVGYVAEAALLGGSSVFGSWSLDGLAWAIGGLFHRGQ